MGSEMCIRDSQEGEQEMVVSKGLGTHTFHVRLFNPAEAVLLRIHG